VFQPALQLQTFWQLVVAVVAVEMVDQVAVVVRFNTQQVIR
jgi:hypothetical protein